MRMTLENFLIVSAIVFAIGLYGSLANRNAIVVLMSIELMLNAVNLAAVAFSRYVVPASVTSLPSDANLEAAKSAVQNLFVGHVFSIMVIAVAAAEIAIGLAIVIAIYRSNSSVDVTHLAEMKK
ncbi:MAG: NADH-quinone oxidoreductase subunit NuoK [Dehalococcoidia bacterium]